MWFPGRAVSAGAERGALCQEAGAWGGTAGEGKRKGGYEGRGRGERTRGESAGTSKVRVGLVGGFPLRIYSN